MNRREVITILSAAVSWPFEARAQERVKIARIGFLGLTPISGSASRIEAFRAGLRALGYVEGNNIIIDFRWARSVDELPNLAAELVGMNVDVIFASSSILVAPARQATKTIPIVFASHADPVGVGHVASLARPGGNVTGLSMLLTELTVKQLEISKEAMPAAKRIGVLWNPGTPSHSGALKALAAAGEGLAIHLQMVPLHRVEEFDAAFAAMIGERLDCFLVIWIAGSRHDDRNGCRHILGGERRRRPPGYDQINVAADQLRCEVRETLSASIGRAIFDDQISPFNIAQFTQTLAQGVVVGRV
jgi:ABC-type uncharacterized transport system substrate-binding protein